ncbi:MAG: TolC family protein, partial [Treponema porcinum]|nr:TolC family protein [Treponema porcinum]
MKNTNVKIIAVFFMLAAASVVFCQESDAVNQDAAEKEKVVLTVDDAVAYALENNKSLKSAAIDLEMKKRA